MANFKCGDVIKVPFPYTDRSTRQSRPALVVSSDDLEDTHGLLWVLMITSAENRGWPGDVSVTNLAAGIKVVTVAFKGGAEATIEVLAGRTHYSSVTMFSALPFINDGKLLALAVTTPQRSPLLPEVPAPAETMPEFKQPENSGALLAPAGTPRLILVQISKDVARILDLPDIKERLQGMGYVPAPTTPEEFDKILREQIATLSKLVIDAGLRAK